MAKGKLTPKQERFVAEYLIDLNATQAAIRAGYSEKTAEVQGPRLLGNVRVAEAIKAAQTARAERVNVTQDYVLAVIFETVERCRQVAPVINRKGEQVLCEDRDGTLVPAFMFDAAGVLKGAEILGKHLGMFKERVEHTGKDGGPIETAEVSDRDIAQRAAFLLQRGLRSGSAKPN